MLMEYSDRCDSACSSRAVLACGTDHVHIAGSAGQCLTSVRQLSVFSSKSESELTNMLCCRGSLEKGLQNGILRMKDGRVCLTKLYKTLLDIAAGMQYLHSAKILHGERALLLLSWRCYQCCGCHAKAVCHLMYQSSSTPQQLQHQMYVSSATTGDLKLGNILLKSTATDLRGALSIEFMLQPWKVPSV